MLEMSHWICSIVHKSRFRLLRFLVMTSKRALPDFRLLLFYVQFQKWWSGAHMAGHYLFAYFCIHFWLCLFLLFGFLLSVKWLFQSWYLFLACGCLCVTFNCLAYVTRRVVEVLGFPLSFRTFAVHQRGKSPWVINQNMLLKLLTYIKKHI